MGLMQRAKGKRYERWVAAQLRARWPDVVVHRSSQADRAYQADVVVESGGPAVLRRLWIECHDSRTPNPRVKLEQAEGDVKAAQQLQCMPVVVWHRLGERAHWATMRMWVACCLADTNAARGGSAIVTLELGEFLDMLEGA